MAETTPFRPFENLIDQETALAHLRDAVAGADDGELFLERRRSEVMSFDDGRLKTASYDASEGFGLRAVRGETEGYAHSTEISEKSLKRAVDTARLAVGSGGGTLADAPQATNRKLYGDADPMADAEFPVKVETLSEIDAYARSLDSRVVQVSATIAASTSSTTPSLLASPGMGGVVTVPQFAARIAESIASTVPSPLKSPSPQVRPD